MTLKTWHLVAIGAGVFLLAGGRKANAATQPTPTPSTPGEVPNPYGGGIYLDKANQRWIMRDDAIEQDGAQLVDSQPGLASEPATGSVQWSDGKSQQYAMPSARPSLWIPIGDLS